MSDDLSGDMLAPSWPNLVQFQIVVKFHLFQLDIIFYPTALKGCQGIVFTHGVQMGGRVCSLVGGGGKKFVRAVSQKP